MIPARRPQEAVRSAGTLHPISKRVDAFFALLEPRQLGYLVPKVVLSDSRCKKGGSRIYQPPDPAVEADRPFEFAQRGDTQPLGIEA
jgi:hypothetical protein